MYDNPKAISFRILSKSKLKSNVSMYVKYCQAGESPLIHWQLEVHFAALDGIVHTT